jgi:putative ABC transport system substrate-binding protein
MRVIVRRREFIPLIAGAASWPFSLHAQQSKVPTIGFLSTSALNSTDRSIAAFRRALGETGYIEGQSIVIEYRTAQDEADRLQMLAADLAHREVAVIVTVSNATAALAAKAATQRIPIVFYMGADPVETGVVASLSRPGGNITGVTTIAGELTEKRVELMHELVPEAKTIGLLVNLTNPAFAKGEPRVGLRTMADRLGVRLSRMNASNRGDIENAFFTFVSQGAGSLVVGPDTFFFSQRELLVTLAAHYAIPTSYFRRDFVEAGGLISYSADRIEAYRQAGTYVGRILNGEKPGDLPVLQPTKLELVINGKTAKALGLTIPQSILLRASEVVE